MEVDDVGGTHVQPMTFVTPEVRTARFPPGASIPQRPDDMAWGTETGETNETKILILEFISAIRNNCDHMNPVDIKRLQRKLELRAADLDALSIFTLRALKPTLDKIPDNLQICPNCHLGIEPGVQVCKRCKLVLTTIQSKVEEMVEGSLIAMATDAVVACVDNKDERVEEVDRQRQPEDMDGNVPQRAPIGCANPQVLNIIYLAQEGHENFIQVNEPPPLNPGRVSKDGTFGFLGKGRKKLKAIADETSAEKEARLLQKKFDDALREVSKHEKRSRRTCQSISPQG